MVTNNNHHIIQDDEMSHQYSYHSSSKNNDDAITKILSASEKAGHNQQDDDESTYYHSIMERRRHIKPNNRDNKDDDEEQSVATNLPQVPLSSAPPVMTSRRRNTNNRRRARRSSSNNNHRRPINPIILIVILGILANWVANRLLNGLNERETIIDDSYYMSRQHTIEHNAAKHHSSSIANNYNHNAQVSQSEGEQMIGKLSLNKLSELSERRYESDGEKHQDDAEIQAKIERLQKGIAQMKQQLASSTNNNNKVDDATINEPNLQDVQQALLSSPITERFVLLRKRLMSLYNEPVPNKEGRSNTTTHPLYNMDSPQFKALNWLANIDKSQITDDDPHVIQRFVLSVLYFATGGPPVDHTTDFTLKRRGGPWRNPTNFLSPNHECEWKSSITKGEGRGGGIRRCDADKNVVELSIYNELAGTIPSELGRLSFLRTLYLGRNNLIGTIPTELGMIRPIASISLQYNHLTGESPNN